jgi:dethiobiotin synthetase
LFITASGTGVGKTYVSAALASALLRTGRRVDVLKPVISGFTTEDFADSDTAVLLKSLGRQATRKTIDAMSPWRFTAPLSPDMAAAQEGRTIDFATLVEFCRQAIDDSADITLIEGVGGVMVPLTKTHTVLDWIAELGIPSIVVVGSYLGTLSHTLTAVAALHARNIPIHGIIISESPDNSIPLTETANSLSRFLPGLPIHTLSRAPMTDQAAANLLEQFAEI